jgi:hypothetical protein
MTHLEMMYEEACVKAADARSRFEHPSASARSRRDAAEDLAFWQGRKAHLAAQL